MILQALNRYYEILLKDEDLNNKLARFGYSTVDVSFALDISLEGELLNVLPLFRPVQRGKNMVERPQPMILPEYAEPTSNVEASFLCGKSEYVLGISKQDDEKPEHSAKRHKEFRRLNIELLKDANNDAARSVMAFLETQNPIEIRKHPAIIPFLSEILNGRRLVFMHENTYVHEVPAIKKIWERFHASKGGVLGQCLVTGEEAPIAQKHRKLKGNVGKNHFESPLVSFNQRSFESYNRSKQQGMNSPISEKAAFAYTTAVNYLLSDDNPNKKFYLGDAAIVYWAESENRSSEDYYANFFEPEYIEAEIATNQEGRKQAEAELEAVTEKIIQTKIPDIKSVLADLGGENPQFYVLGLAPVGDGRLLVRFFITDLFEKIVQNILAHYRDFELPLNPQEKYSNQPKYITVRHVVDACIPQKSKTKDKQREALASMASSVFRAILTNTAYPVTLFYSVMNRIRAETDDPDKRLFKVSYVRVAIIKAFLIRKYRYKTENPFEEVLTMALNEQCTIPAYLLGRLFAVLERVQAEAIKNLNASMKDRYFTSACASPGNVFPRLLLLSQHHLAKLDNKIYWERHIEDIVHTLDVENNSIPVRLTLEQQGIFILGYYHQRKDLWTAKPKDNDQENDN